jgi:chemotaxis protein CheX
MLAVASRASVTTADYVNPVIRATRDVFEMMLGCTPKRVGLTLKTEDAQNPFAISAVIGITGRATGTIVFYVSESTALQALQRMTGTEASRVDEHVCDAVGELTNMIAGAAKAQLAELQLSISIPNVVHGDRHSVYFPSHVTPFRILFDSELGPFCVEVGFTALP